MNLKPYPEYKDSGVAWLGDVPKHWEIHPNRALFYERNKKNNPKMELLSVTITKGVIRQKELISNTSKKDSSNEDKSKYKLVKQGDIAYNKMRMWQGAVGASKYEGIVSPAYIIVHPRVEMNEWFCHYLFRSPKYVKESHRYSYGICDDQLSLRIDDFKKIFTPKPQLQEQRQIVKFLDYKTAQIARFIKAKKRMIELLKEQKQVIINDAVTGKIVIKDEGGRLKVEKRPDSSFIPHPSSFLQKVPEHWEVRRLRTIATVKPSGVDKKSHEGELPVQLCNYVDVYKNQEINSSLNFMKATATEEEIKNFTLIPGDIVITKDSETWKDIAVPAIVTENMNVVCAYHLALIRATKEITSKYLYRAITADPIADHFRVSANGVTRFGLSQGAIKDAIIPVPTVAEQSQIVTYIETKTAALDQAISRTEREIALIQEYRTRLVSDVVTGKIDVRDIEIPGIAGIDDTIDESIDEPEGEEELETEEAEE
ncbi:MAG TPA: restriction endonuclease subunit S [Candidatus Paceibacterota bacterium]